MSCSGQIVWVVPAGVARPAKKNRLRTRTKRALWPGQRGTTRRLQTGPTESGGRAIRNASNERVGVASGGTGRRREAAGAGSGAVADRAGLRQRLGDEARRQGQGGR